MQALVNKGPVVLATYHIASQPEHTHQQRPSDLEARYQAYMKKTPWWVRCQYPETLTQQTQTGQSAAAESAGELRQTGELSHEAEAQEVSQDKRDRGKRFGANCIEHATAAPSMAVPIPLAPGP